MLIVVAVRSPSAVTFSAGFPRRNVQVVLRLYADAAAVLESFDVDACAVAFDGRRVLASARGLRALRERAAGGAGYCLIVAFRDIEAVCFLTWCFRVASFGRSGTTKRPLLTLGSF